VGKAIDELARGTQQVEEEKLAVREAAAYCRGRRAKLPVEADAHLPDRFIASASETVVYLICRSSGPGTIPPLTRSAWPFRTDKLLTFAFEAPVFLFLPLPFSAMFFSSWDRSRMAMLLEAAPDSSA